MIQIEYSSDIQKLSILLSTQRHGEMKIVGGILRNTEPQNESRIGRTSKTLSKESNMLSLTRKSRKFQTKTLVLGNL